MYNSEVTSKSARVHTHLITGSAPKHIVLQYYKTSTVTANLYYKNKAYKVVEVCPSEKLQQYFPLGCNLLNPTARLPSPASALRLRLILRVSECSTALWSWLQKGAGRQNWISHKCSCNQLTAKLETSATEKMASKRRRPANKCFWIFPILHMYVYNKELALYTRVRFVPRAFRFRSKRRNDLQVDCK